jgi:elongation factor 1-alpha
MSQFLKKVGYNMKYVQFIPTSGFNGDNLVERSLHLEWYDGPTLIEALDRVEVPKRAVDKPLRIPIQITHRIGGVGTVIQGRVETGTLKQGT